MPVRRGIQGMTGPLGEEREAGRSPKQPSALGARGGGTLVPLAYRRAATFNL